MDINCDIGESYGNFSVGSDDKLFPYITSCSIACGFHAGDPWYIDQTIDKALAHGVRIGAHPSYPDLQGFGRRKMEIPYPELAAIIRYQVAALRGMVVSKGGELSYVKPHGALYNSMSSDYEEARCVLLAIRSISPSLAIMGPPNSATSRVAQELNIPFIAEAFADRRYGTDGNLLPRSHPKALIDTVEDLKIQATSIVERKEVILSDGSHQPMIAQSICLHGDNPQAPLFAKTLAAIFN